MAGQPFLYNNGNLKDSKVHLCAEFQFIVLTLGTLSKLLCSPAPSSCLKATVPCWTTLYASASPHSHPGCARSTSFSCKGQS